jgi:hypothetical protein
MFWIELQPRAPSDRQMRKGEMTKRRIDRDFPHRVAIRIPEGSWPRG